MVAGPCYFRLRPRDHDHRLAEIRSEHATLRTYLLGRQSGDGSRARGDVENGFARSKCGALEQ